MTINGEHDLLRNGLKSHIKVLIVNAHSDKGGASRAARRLENCLRNHNQLSIEFLSVSDFNSSTKLGESLLKIKAVFNRFPAYFLSAGAAYFSTPMISSKKAIDYINKSDADIVNLHWVNSGVLSIEDIGKITKPIVWSLHDMWPFTGGCHYSDKCVGFRLSCGDKCHVIGSKFGAVLSQKYFNKKRVAYSKTKSLTLLGLSSWMASEAKSSNLSSTYSVYNLPNPIDTEVFQPQNSLVSRKNLSLPRDKKLVLFGAMSVSDKRKGFSELLDSVSKIATLNVELVVFGHSSPDLARKLGKKIHFMGNINSDIKLAELYSAADVMVVPSLQENLSNSIMESLACGTPVVGFGIGGNSDMISHRINGYLATAIDVNDLAAGIDFVLCNNRLPQLKAAARDKVLKDFSYDVLSKKYFSLFQRIIIKQ